MAIISERLRVKKGTRNTGAQNLLIRVCKFFSALLLITAFALAGAPTASGTPASTDQLASSTSTLRFLSCNGDTPGFCPNGPFTNT